MPAKINHLAVVKSPSLARTWEVVAILWPLLRKLLGGIEVMSIQNFGKNLVRNVTLLTKELPAAPRIQSGEALFFYGSKSTGGSVSVRQTARHGIVNLSLNPPADSEAILSDMWTSLASVSTVGVFVGEEMELNEDHIAAVESRRLSPLALPLCTLAIVPPGDFEDAGHTANRESGGQLPAKGMFFRGPR